MHHLSSVSSVLTAVVAAEQLLIFYLETIATHSSTTSRVFGMSVEELKRPSVTTLFRNLGIYNALLAVGLLYGLMTSNSEITCLFLLFVLSAAIYGAVSSDKMILVKQGGPTLLALLALVWFS